MFNKMINGLLITVGINVFVIEQVLTQDAHSLML